MDRHTCRLCFRRFHNGRALGGHMRSHVMAAASAAAAAYSSPPLSLSLAASTSSTELDDNPPPPSQPRQQKPQPQTPCAGREGTRKRFDFFDSPEPEPELSSGGRGRGRTAAGRGESSVVQDGGESDTESSSPRFAVSRRRSKRPRRRRPAPPPASDPEHEQPAASSVSDATTEEDVAMSLVMLSRDSWARPSRARSGCWGSATSAAEHEQNNDGADHEQSLLRARGGRQHHQCDVCGKVFRSYQALGGHRASIKKGKGGCVPVPLPVPVPVSSNKNKAHRAVVVHHECPFCFRVFESGQALGGHKRAHMPYGAGAPPPRTPVLKCGGDSSGSVAIDLNVPAAATTDDDFELSAVYDAEFGSARQ